MVCSAVPVVVGDEAVARVLDLTGWFGKTDYVNDVLL
jgi:hypothetical protein